MGKKKGKGKGKGQSDDSSSQSAQERQRRAPQQVYQPPQRRGPLQEESPRREQPSHSQQPSGEQPSVAYRKPSLEQHPPKKEQQRTSQEPSVPSQKEQQYRSQEPFSKEPSVAYSKPILEKQPSPTTSSKGRGRDKGHPTVQPVKVGAQGGDFFQKDIPTAQPETCSDTSPKPSEKKTKKYVSPEVSQTKETLSKLAGLSLEDPLPIKSKLAKRPDYGKLGNRIGLYVNYFKLEYKKMTIYHYDIDILEATKDKKAGKSLMSEGRTAKEDIKKGVEHVEREKRRNIGKAKCRQIIAEMIKSEALQKYFPVYDGQKNLFTSKPLPYDTKISFPVKVKIDGIDKNFYVAIQPVFKNDCTNCIDLQPLIDVYDKRSNEIPLEVLLVYETVMNHRDPPFTQFHFRNSFFSQQGEKRSLECGMEIWFGYNQNVHLTERGPVLIVNMAAKVFHKAGPVIHYANEVLGCNITRLPKLDTFQIKNLETALRGIMVKVTHQRHPRKYKIKGLSKLSANEIKFEDENKRSISVAQYFHQKYNFKLSFPQLPCLHMQTSSNTNIPMEVCDVVEGQPKIGKLSGDMTSKMIRSTAVPPGERFATIKEDVKKIHTISKRYMDAFGLIMDINVMKVDGRLITAPQLQYGDTQSTGKLAVPDQRGVWRIEDGKQFYRVIQVKSWALISFADERRFDMNLLKKYCHFLVQSANKCGINMNREQYIRPCGRNDRTENVIVEAKKSGIDFAIVVLNRRDKFHTYDEVKFLADFKHRLVTQCMEDKTLSRINDQITTNVCLKINVKLGGINHVLKQRLKIFSSPVMVIGADAIHWTRGLGYPSIVAVVASFEPTATKYMLVCDTHRNKRKGKISQEIIRNMKPICSELLEGFRLKAGRYPERIIVFRDGVSDGQFQHAVDFEVSGIQQACQETIGKVIQVTFIVVQKRHQTRMYPQNPGQGCGRGKNVPPGTVVDKDITHPVYFDFFVCSHEGIQGTSKPAHYTVLHDDYKFSADELQQLCHFLCHTFVRCTRSVSVPAPVLYADLAAFRAKKYADLFINADDISVSSGDSEFTEREFPPNVTEAIKSMKNFEHSMFYI